MGRGRIDGQAERLLYGLRRVRAVVQRKRVRSGALRGRCAGDRTGCRIQCETRRKCRRD